MRVGIVCEGSTDFEVLQLLANEVCGAEECVLIHPDLDRLRAGDMEGGAGWQAVRKLLRSGGLHVSAALFDVLVVQVDASIRHDAEVKKVRLRAAGEDEPELGPLCDHVKSWAKDGLPDNGLVVLPREELETWIVRVRTNLKNVESIADPVQVLVDRKLVGVRKNGKPDKKPEEYRKLAEPLVPLARDRRKLATVPELERFIGKMKVQKKRAG